MSEDKKLDYLKVTLADKLSPEQINKIQQDLVKHPLVCGVSPVFQESGLGPFGDKESDAIDDYEVSRLKLKEPNELLKRMLLGRVIVGVSKTHDDSVELHFSDGSYVALEARQCGQLPELVISKDIYVKGVQLKTVEV